MGKRTIIPFGPQHPVLPEPIHLDLVLEDEKVIEAIPSIGFIHRGLEKLVEKKDFQEFVYVAERICGICCFIHGMGYCQSVEGIMNIEMPPTAPSTCGRSGPNCRVSTATCCGWACWPTRSASKACSCSAGACAKRCSTSLT